MRVTCIIDVPMFISSWTALQRFYRARGWIVPWQGIVAVINFAPGLGDVDLAMAGVDVLLALERPPSVVFDSEGRPLPGKEQEVIDSWLRPRVTPKGTQYNWLRAMLFPK